MTAKNSTTIEPKGSAQDSDPNTAVNKYLQAAHSIEIPDESLTHESNIAIFWIETPHGPLCVQAGRGDSIFIRGTPEAIIGFGLIEPDWLPGLPGRNACRQTVYFLDGGPWLPVGKDRRGKRPRVPKVTVLAWGFLERTVEVQTKMSKAQQEKLDALRAAHGAVQKVRAGVAGEHFGKLHEYRTEGNVIYFPGAGIKCGEKVA